MWSFVQKKGEHTMDLDRHGCSSPARSSRCMSEIGVTRVAKELWAHIPTVYREQATFHTDQYAVYTGVIPAEQHKAITKHARTTNHIERFNNTLRQRVSRLVRDTLSFSKKLANHIRAIKFLYMPLQSYQGRKHYLCSTTEKFGFQGSEMTRVIRLLGRLFRLVFRGFC